VTGARRSLLAVACIVASACASTIGPTAGPGAVAPSGRTATGTPPATGASSPPASAAPTPDSGTPAALQVAESGFTTFSADGQDFASFAAILVNPNGVTWRAHLQALHVDFFGSDGALAGSTDATVSLRPGGTTAIGGETFGAGTASRMVVEIPDQASDFVTDDGTEVTFDVLDVSTTRKDGLNVTTGRLVNRSAVRQDSIELTAVYRDRAGTIIGGASGGLESIEPGGGAAFEIVDSAPYREIGTTEIFWQAPG
jgi:hypothetical protein